MNVSGPLPSASFAHTEISPRGSPAFQSIYLTAYVGMPRRIVAAGGLPTPKVTQASTARGEIYSPWTDGEIKEGPLRDHVDMNAPGDTGNATVSSFADSATRARPTVTPAGRRDRRRRGRRTAEGASSISIVCDTLRHAWLICALTAHLCLHSGAAQSGVQFTRTDNARLACL